jgi:DNA-binding transcriptional MerR regulator
MIRKKQAIYSIGEVSEHVGQEPHVLRYWEQEFEVLDPRKNKAGRRVYTDADVAVIERIQHLLKQEKYTIAGAQQALARADARADAEADLRADLRRLRAFLVRLRDALPDEEAAAEANGD